MASAYKKLSVLRILSVICVGERKGRRREGERERGREGVWERKGKKESENKNTCSMIFLCVAFMYNIYRKTYHFRALLYIIYNYSSQSPHHPLDLFIYTVRTDKNTFFVLFS